MEIKSIEEFVRGFKDKVELHRHLEGSIPLNLIWEYRKNLKTFSFNSFEEMKKVATCTTRSNSLIEVLKKFTLFSECFQCGPEFTYKCTLENIKNAKKKEGISVLELRFSPDFMVPVECNDGSYPEIWDEHFKQMLKAREEVKGIKVGFIAIVSRNLGKKSGIKTSLFCKKWKKEICGYDLAASESLDTIKDFIEPVKMIHDIGIPITVHTGENTGYKYIEESIKAYKPVKRIGHGVSLIENKELMELVKKEGICVECCLTSNFITKCVDKIEDHPVKQMLRAGVKVCLNTDDPGLFEIDLNDEWIKAMDKLKLSQDDMKKMNEYAKDSLFV